MIDPITNQDVTEDSLDTDLADFAAQPETSQEQGAALANFASMHMKMENSIGQKLKAEVGPVLPLLEELDALEQEFTEDARMGQLRKELS